MSETEFAAHLQARAAAFAVSVTASQAHDFEKFYDLLAKWNRRINLTALELGSSAPIETLDRLFIEPLIAAQMIPKAPLSIIDLGSGAGSPALPLKILRPAIRLTMVETRGRKAAFLREAVRTLRLDDVDVEQTRFQSLPVSLVSTFDVAVVRALRIDAELVSVIGELLKTSGRFITFGADEAPSGFVAGERRQLPDRSEAVSWVLASGPHQKSSL
jgi:16S rRNA (guanine527-N7)-methyltransferase